MPTKAKGGEPYYIAHYAKGRGANALTAYLLSTGGSVLEPERATRFPTETAVMEFLDSQGLPNWQWECITPE